MIKFTGRELYEMMDGKKYYFSEPKGASSDFFVFLRSKDPIDSDIKLGKLERESLNECFFLVNDFNN